MTVEITRDIVADVLKRVKELTKKELLVGIPEKNAGRKDDDEDPDVNNAYLGRLHEFGSPAKNIPPRPFLIPGVRDARKDIVKRLKVAGERALAGGLSDIDKEMTKAGKKAVESVQNKFHDGSMAPISEITKKRRLTRTATYKNASAKKKQAMMEDFLAGDHLPLVDTHQLLRSVTFVLHKKGSRD